LPRQSAIALFARRRFVAYGVERAAAGEVAAQLKPEDGVIWVYGVGEDGVMVFTDFGIESLVGLIKMYKDNPSLLKRGDDEFK
jgi:hypothetical protein